MPREMQSISVVKSPQSSLGNLKDSQDCVPEISLKFQGVRLQGVGVTGR